MRARWATGVLAAALLLAPNALGAADELTFPVTKALTVSAGKAVTVGLCNKGASAAKVTFTTEGFDFATRSGVDPASVLPAPALLTVPMHACEPVTLTVTSESLLPG